MSLTRVALFVALTKPKYILNGTSTTSRESTFSLDRDTIAPIFVSLG